MELDWPATIDDTPSPAASAAMDQVMPLDVESVTALEPAVADAPTVNEVAHAAASDVDAVADAAIDPAGALALLTPDAATPAQSSASTTAESFPVDATPASSE